MTNEELDSITENSRTTIPTKTPETMAQQLEEAAMLLEACRGYFSYLTAQGLAPDHEWERPIIEWLARYMRPSGKRSGQ